MEFSSLIVSRFLVLLPLLLLTGCLIEADRHDEPAHNEADGGHGGHADVHSSARPEETASTHIHLDWTIDFERGVLDGTAVHSLRRADAGKSGFFVVDIKHLEISGVRGGRGELEGERLWSIRKGDDILGDALIVELEPGDDRVGIEYQTTREGSGLQWLKPSQTSSGKYPFLFSQAQAIHARTILPCQDTPAVRVTYSASVRCPEGLEVVMSAERAGKEDGAFLFNMPHPIPSYLIAVACGELVFEAMGPRTGVWAEPAVVKAAAWEFGETEQMIDVIESLYGSYRWGRFDILVLPPSFPFGGMENPLLTFATPTVLAGDRSLTSLIAHELAHSWSGNLVTNATWRDFWLNEGFTVYVEQRVVEALYGKDRADMEIMLAFRDLKAEMAEMEPRDQILHVDLDGRDPDDGFTGVPYDKGAAFLRLLEEVMGRDAFDPFLRNWFDTNAFQSRTTSDFRRVLEEKLAELPPHQRRRIDLDLWIEGSGIPADAPVPSSPAFERIDEAVGAWRDGTKSLSDFQTAGWTTQEWLHFLGTLKGNTDRRTMALLDDAFKLTERKNSEITCAWMLLAIDAGYDPAWLRLREFLTTQGRRKFLRPIYTALHAREDTRAMALEIYREARPLYHAISTATIDEILGLGK